MTKKLESSDDRKSVWGTKQFGGYAGVKHTAKQIMSCIPNSKIYVEAFAGMGRTCDETKHEQIILNDKSEYSNNYCKKKFRNAIVENMDFIDTIKKYDSEDTFFLFDPPWESNIYDGNNNIAYCNMKPSQYYNKLLEIVKTIKGDWIILSSLNPSRYQFKTDYFERHILSEKNVLFGKKAKTRLTSNLPITSKSWQELL